jgi:excisionase family DNA binding protein
MPATSHDISPELRQAIADAVRAEVRAALMPASPPAAPLFFTVRQAMDLLSLSRTEIYRRVRAGDLVLIKRGRRTLFCSEDIRRYAERLRGEPHDERR